MNQLQGGSLTWQYIPWTTEVVDERTRERWRIQYQVNINGTIGYSCINLDALMVTLREVLSHPEHVYKLTIHEKRAE